MKHLEAYNAWKRKNSLTRITLLSSMENDVMREYRKYGVTMELWAALKERFSGTSLAKLRKLIIRFDTYKKAKVQHETTSQGDVEHDE